MIDQYIAGSFDQRLTLELLLTHTLDQLEVDAAVIFLLEPYQRILQYAVGTGFHTHIIETANLNTRRKLSQAGSHGTPHDPPQRSGSHRTESCTCQSLVGGGVQVHGGSLP